MSDRTPKSYQRFFAELKRRHVFRVMAVYGIVGFIILQVVDLAVPALLLPEWTYRLVALLLLVGFPVSVIIAWAFEITPEGIRKTESADPEEIEAIVSQPASRRWPAGLLALLGVAALVASAWWVGRQTAPAADTVGPDTAVSPDTARVASLPDSIPLRSVAVLPLDDNSPDEADAWFAGAMTEALTNGLQNVHELHVTARNSSAKYPESGMTVGEFALNKLGVAYVLEGSVQLHEGRALITVQLIDATTEGHLWGEDYDVELIDVVDVQLDVAREVADRLATTFTEREEKRIEAAATDDPLAYELYLRSLNLRPHVPEERDEAIDLMRRAVERDPEFGVAWYALASLYSWRALEGREWADSTFVAAERAIEHTEDPALRLTMRATLSFHVDGETEKALMLIAEALQANPTLKETVRRAREFYRIAGDLPEAVRLARRAAALDPLGASNWTALAGLYSTAGLDTLAERALRRAMEVDPVAGEPWEELLWLRLFQRRYQEALAAADSSEARGAPRAAARRGVAFLWAGEEEKAWEVLEAAHDSMDFRSFWGYAPELVHLRLLRADTTAARALLDRFAQVIGRLREVMSENDPRLPQQDMNIAAVRGDRDEAVAALRRYIDLGGRNRRIFGEDPLFSRVRDDPAFEAELARLEEIVERQRRQIERDLGEES